MPVAGAMVALVAIPDAVTSNVWLTPMVIDGAGIAVELPFACPARESTGPAVSTPMYAAMTPDEPMDEENDHAYDVGSAEPAEWTNTA
jgi:hypothetical protein